MYRKNTAGQFISAQLLLTATGAVATGLSPAARRCVDGTFAAGTGTFTEDGTTGTYKYAMSQADTNGNNISITVSATGAMPVCVNLVTTAADPTNATSFGLTNLDAAISSRMATYTQPTGFLAATFPSGTVANQTNITAGTITTTTNLTNLPSIPANWLTAAGINAGALNGKGDWLLASSYTAPTNLTAAQIATGVWTDTTAADFTTALSIGKSVMNGVALGTGLTVNSITGGVTVTTNNDKAGYTLSQGFPGNFSSMAISGAGIVSADIKKVNAITVNGDGGATPWGP